LSTGMGKAICQVRLHHRSSSGKSAVDSARSGKSSRLFTCSTSMTAISPRWQKNWGSPEKRSTTGCTATPSPTEHQFCSALPAYLPGTGCIIFVEECRIKVTLNIHTLHTSLYRDPVSLRLPGWRIASENELATTNTAQFSHLAHYLLYQLRKVCAMTTGHSQKPAIHRLAGAHPSA